MMRAANENKGHRHAMTGISANNIGKSKRRFEKNSAERERERRRIRTNESSQCARTIAKKLAILVVNKQIGGGGPLLTQQDALTRDSGAATGHTYTQERKKKETQQAFLVLHSGYALPVLFSRNSLSLWHIIPQRDYA